MRRILHRLPPSSFLLPCFSSFLLVAALGNDTPIFQSHPYSELPLLPSYTPHSQALLFLLPRWFSEQLSLPITIHLFIQQLLIEHLLYTVTMLDTGNATLNKACP